MFVRLADWMALLALLARSSSAKDVELLVLRQEALAPVRGQSFLYTEFSDSSSL